jgi:hypothetical protein
MIEQLIVFHVVLVKFQNKLSLKTDCDSGIADYIQKKLEKIGLWLTGLSRLQPADE